MPPKKALTRALKKVDVDTSAKTTAAAFRDAAPVVADDIAVSPDPIKTPAATPPATEEDDIENAHHILKIVYRTQDFLNEHMTLLAFVQIVVFACLAQMVYFGIGNFENLWDHLPTIGFNLAAISVGLILNYTKSKEENPPLPEFNYLHSIIFPLLISILNYLPSFFIINLALNYGVADTINPVFRLFSAFIFFEMYSPENGPGAGAFLGMCVLHMVLVYAFAYVSRPADEKIVPSMQRLEIFLVALLVLNMIVNPGFTQDSIAMQIAQKLVLGLLAPCMLIFPIIEYIPIIVSAVLYGVLFCVATIYQLNPILGENAITWVYDYVTLNPVHLSAVKAWIGMLLVAIPAVMLSSKKLSLNFRRKIWHLLFVVALIGVNPDLMVTDPEFVLVSLIGGTTVFILIELLRFNEVGPIGKALKNSLRIFQDDKDSTGPLNLSYIYLIAGVTFPLAYDYMTGRTSIVRYMGLIGIGLGDTAASVVGARFGTIKWKGSNKSVQGTVAFVVVVFASLVAIDVYAGKKYGSVYTPVENWENVLVSVIMAALLEATATLNDNLLIPLTLPTAYDVLHRSYA